MIPRIRTFAKAAVAYGPLRWVLCDRLGRVPILRYHAIGATPCSHSVTVAVWRRHLRFFTRKGLEVVSLRDHFERPATRPGRRVVMTFDDGFASGHDIARQDLFRHGYTATFFVEPRFVGRRPDWLDADLDHLLVTGHAELAGPLELFLAAARLDEDHARRELPVLLRLPRRACLVELHALYRLKSERLLNWDQIRALSAAGMEIGAHCRGCGRPERRDAAALRRELVGAREEIEAQAGCEVSFFGRRYGPGPRDLARLLREAGYSGACSCERGYWRPESDPYDLPRIDVAALVAPADLELVLGERLRPLVDHWWRRPGRRTRLPR